ncbi:SDR family oxidoreductase [Allokutzneria albata]|uniref:NAD(P)H dehydrogenase (Quinone) n=1 Tax=Allokutzneria albata TaxID=211114 RepID=A0A1G9WPW3_ALLAB|nr:SDR family oxidoreductase [Allokutzneria albata]SDM86518.1 NAD(P)H dehydrogenase (quinone) [Allokutzneria albata]
MIVITGATGGLGALVVESLLERVPADQVAAAVRSPEKASGLGVRVRAADYSDPASLERAFAGADVVLLISGNEFGKRAEQHTNAINAAVKAGVGRLVYTSAPFADSGRLALADEHKATEEVLLASGLTYTILRNAWYHENYAQAITGAAGSGVLTASAGDGRVASAARADYAEAAAVVLTTEGHDNKIYELSGDTAWSFAELAEEISRASGRAVAYRNLTTEEHIAQLTGFGLPEPVAGVFADVDANIAKGGVLDHTPGVLRELIGHPTRPIADYVSGLLKK